MQPSKEERMKMSYDELLRTVWLLDEWIQFRDWHKMEDIPKKDMEVFLSVKTKFGYESKGIGGGYKITVHAVLKNGILMDLLLKPLPEYYAPYAWTYYPEPMMEFAK